MKDYTFRVRMTQEDRKKLEKVRKAYRVDSMSQAVRILIRESVDRLEKHKAWEPWQEGADEKEETMCEDCGLFKEADGEFLLIEPSDCHAEGGHYRTDFFATGRHKRTDRPWQIGLVPDLTDEEMAGAKDA